MATYMELAARVEAAQRARRALARYAEARDYREALTPEAVVKGGTDAAGAAQTDLENAAAEVGHALTPMAEAGCDKESLGEVQAVVDAAGVLVPQLRAGLEKLRPTPAEAGLEEV